MIVCSLNGKTAYPSSSDKIKVTYENQFVKDSGSYTYDISFPMDIISVSPWISHATAKSSRMCSAST